jgi:23S rRNA (guanosine2251-2'-O)-methyltransferase
MSLLIKPATTFPWSVLSYHSLPSLAVLPSHLTPDCDMSQRTQRRRSGFSGNHQKSWLWGKHAVLEVLRAGRWPVRELYATTEARSELDAAGAGAVASVRTETSRRISQLCGHQDHQGLAARMAPFPVADADELMNALSPAKSAGPRSASLIVICDRIQDAHNFGAILRNCDAMGVRAVIVGTNHQSGVTPHVARASAGAVNHIELYQADHLAETLTALSRLGFQTVAASEKSSVAVSDADLSRPTVLIIGSEGQGVADELLQQVDQTVAIPMLGNVQSLNAAVACGIVLHEIRRQQAAFQNKPN